MKKIDKHTQTHTLFSQRNERIHCFVCVQFSQKKNENDKKRKVHIDVTRIYAQTSLYIRQK